MFRIARMFNVDSLSLEMRDSILLVAHQMLAQKKDAAEIRAGDFMASIFYMDAERAKLAFPDVYEEFGGEWFAAKVLTRTTVLTTVFFLSEEALQEKWEVLPEGIWTPSNMGTHLEYFSPN